jgi:outer membrane protein TolC
VEPDSPRAPLLTVAEAVEEALTRNRTVLEARVQSLISGARKEAARAELLPRVDLRGTYSVRDEAPQAVAPELGTSFTVGPKDVADLAVVMDFPIFASGRYLNTYKAAVLAQRSAETVARATDSDIAALVTAAAFDLLEAKRSVEAALANETAFEQQVKDAQALKDAGRVTAEAVLEAQVSHDVARRDRERLESSIPVLRIVLNGLLGRPTDAETEIVDQPETRGPPWTLADLEAEALERRPEMLAARLDLEVAQRLHKAAIGAALPELRGELAWSTTDNDFQTPKDVGTFGLALDVPLFAGGGNRARIRRARYEMDLARIRMEDVEVRILTELAEAHREVVEAHRDIPVANRAVERATESLRIQREKFAGGRATSREVLDSTTLLSNARVAQVTTVYNYNIALQRLHRARGADPYEPPLPPPKEP